MCSIKSIDSIRSTAKLFVFPAHLICWNYRLPSVTSLFAPIFLVPAKERQIGTRRICLCPAHIRRSPSLSLTYTFSLCRSFFLCWALFALVPHVFASLFSWFRVVLLFCPKFALVQVIVHTINFSSKSNDFVAVVYCLARRRRAAKYERGMIIFSRIKNCYR